MYKLSDNLICVKHSFKENMKGKDTPTYAVHKMFVNAISHKTIYMYSTMMPIEYMCQCRTHNE